MSLKMFMNKKVSNDSKCANSKIESDSAPFCKLIDVPTMWGFNEDDPDAHKHDPNVSSEEMEDLPITLHQDGENEYNGRNKAMVYFDTLAKVITKQVFSSDKQVMIFPMLVVKNFIDGHGYFSSLRTISNCICDMINSKLERQGYFPFFVESFKYENGSACDMRIKSHNFMALGSSSIPDLSNRIIKHPGPMKNL